MRRARHMMAQDLARSEHRSPLHTTPVGRRLGSRHGRDALSKECSPEPRLGSGNRLRSTQLVEFVALMWHG